MGYYTYYSCKWIEMGQPKYYGSCLHDERIGQNFCPVCGVKVQKFSLNWAIAKHIEDDNGETYGFDTSGNAQDSCKWYRHEDDMRQMSILFPDVLFVLRGEGEESGDLWIKYFLNGKTQSEPVEITFPKFDKDKLE